MGPPTSKFIVSPAGELAMSVRNDPGPESTVFVTVAAQAEEDSSMAITIQVNGIGFLMVVQFKGKEFFLLKVAIERFDLPAVLESGQICFYVVDPYHSENEAEETFALTPTRSLWCTRPSATRSEMDPKRRKTVRNWLVVW